MMLLRRTVGLWPLVVTVQLQYRNCAITASTPSLRTQSEGKVGGRCKGISGDICPLAFLCEFGRLTLAPYARELPWVGNSRFNSACSSRRAGGNMEGGNGQGSGLYMHSQRETGETRLERGLNPPAFVHAQLPVYKQTRVRGLTPLGVRTRLSFVFFSASFLNRALKES